MTLLPDLLEQPPGLLAFGEPTHGESAFLQARNRAFADLAGRGFRSIALESDRAAGLIADAFVRGDAGVTIERALAEGFSHGFGALPANRDLLLWMRDANAGRPDAERLTFHGFDAPLEIESVPSPRRYLARVCEFLAVDRMAEIDELIGDESRWSDQAAIWQAERSPGRGAAAQRLRVIADDLVTELYVRAPAHPDGWRAALVHATSAINVLRYHAAAAGTLPAERRIGRLSSVRDALMAENLLAIRAAEAHRGPTLVFAHNQHVRRDPVEPTTAGAIVGTLLGRAYAVVVGSLGASPALGIGEPEPGTYESGLRPGYVRAAEVEPGEKRTHDYRYFPLDRALVDQADLVLHVPTGTSPEALADRILALPDGAQQAPGRDQAPGGEARHGGDQAPGGVDRPGGETLPGGANLPGDARRPRVEQLVASEEAGSPEGSWGDRFFYVGPDRRRPFATVVEHDVPGFDEASRLDRPGVFRLNVEVGRAEFERLFGFAPKDFEEHRHEFDFARLDTVVPHPGYALHGFVSIVMPGPDMLPEVDRLLAIAYARAVGRDERRDSVRRAGTGANHSSE